jgi:4-amino-4-deoxy-L-arabinose transferase-like glycosyltransferase
MTLTAAANIHDPQPLECNHDTIFPFESAHAGRSIVAGLLLAVLLILYALFLHGFYEPAHPGVDQNGYMVTARLLSEHGRLYFKPHNPLQFAGRMMVLTPDGKIFAKYPPGVGFLGAIARIVYRPSAMYLVDPVCTVMALFFAYLLFRSLLDPFLALMGVLWLSLNPVTLTYADDANSHGAALGFTVMGFWALLTWWRKGGMWRGIIAGLALGFCCSIRYTEFLWCLPLLAVVILAVRGHQRSWRQGLAVLIAWAMPVAVLAVINWASFGEPWRTGYWFCREQTGFAWRYFIGNPGGMPPRQGNWQTLLEQMENLGLFLLFPLALAGLIRLFWTSRKLALAIALWVIPSATVYMFYYWAPANDFTTAYLRFFLDIFPALIMVALWLLARAAGPNATARALIVGFLTVVSVGYSACTITPQLLNAKSQKLQLIAARQALQARLQPGSIVFADEQMCNYLNSIGGYRLYSATLFSPQAFVGMDRVADHSGPIPFQPARAELYTRLLGRKTTGGQWRARSLAQEHAIEWRIMRRAWSQHKQVAFLIPSSQIWPLVPHEPGVNIHKVTVISALSMPAWNTTQWMGGNIAANAQVRRRLRLMRMNLQRRNQRTLLVLSPEKAPRPGAQALRNGNGQLILRAVPGETSLKNEKRGYLLISRQ